MRRYTMNYSIGMSVSPDTPMIDLLFIGSGVRWNSGSFCDWCQIEDVYATTGFNTGLAYVNGKPVGIDGNAFDVWATIMRELCGNPE
jgi:hypothetical protein